MGDTLKGFTHVGLLCNEPPSMTGLPFIQSSDELNRFSLSSGAWKAMPRRGLKMSNRRRGFPSEANVKRGRRIVDGDKELTEKLPQ